MTTSIVFDLDGTLIDSAPDIAAAVNQMLEAECVAPLDLATVIGFTGNGLPHLVKMVIHHCALDIASHPRLTQVTLDHYKAAPSEMTVLYPGVRDALQALKSRGHALGICTNKPEGAARLVLDDLGLAPYFDVVVGGDTLNVRKPDPAALWAAFDALPNGPHLYVGDSEVDAETALRAEVPFFLFTQGYSKRPAEELPHSARYDHSSHLPELVERHLVALAK